MKTLKTKYYYITDPFYTTVKDSQVTNWLQVLAKEHYQFDLIITTPLKYWIKNHQHRKSKIRDIKQKLPINVYQIPILKGRDKTGISYIIKLLFFFFIFLVPAIRKRPIIVQTRSVTNGKVLIFLKRLLGVKSIFDFRGAGAEEYINGLGLKHIDETKSTSVRAKYFALLKEQAFFIKNVDATCVVSSKLKDYVLDKFEQADSNKIHVVPGAADEDMFFFSEQVRTSHRDKHGFVLNQTCFIYTGRLDSHWHMKDFTFEVMSKVLNENPSSFFMCITPDVNTALKLKTEYNISDSQIFIKAEPNHEINNYLCGADYGILFRDDILTNKVASPTKLPEYLLAGLPVIISEGVGDYSDYIDKHQYGLKVNNSVSQVANLIKSQTPFSNEKRKEISTAVRKDYSKQVNLQTLISIYNKLSTH